MCVYEEAWTKLRGGERFQRGRGDRRKHVGRRIIPRLVARVTTPPPRAASETAADEVRGLDEEGSVVAPEAGFQLARKRVDEVSVQVVVVADVEGSARIRRPAEEELAEVVRGDRVVVNAPAREGEARELVCGLERVDVLVEGDAASVVAREPVLREAERHVEVVRRLVGNVAVRVEELARPRLLQSEADDGQRVSLLLLRTQPGVLRRALRQGRTADAREARPRAEVVVHLAPAVAEEVEEVDLLGQRRACVAEEVLRVGRLLRASGEGVNAELPGEVVLVAGVVAPADECLSLEVRPHLPLVSPVLQTALPVVVAAEIAVELPRDDLLLRLRLGRVPDVEVVAVRVDAPRKPHVGAIPGGAPHAVDVPAEVALALREVVGVDEAVERSAGVVQGFGGERAAARFRAEHLEVERRRLVEAYARVEAADVVAATRKLVDRAEEADEVLLAHVALETEDADRRVLVEHTEERTALRDERVVLLLVADA